MWWGLGPRDQPTRALYSYLMTWVQILILSAGGPSGKHPSDTFSAKDGSMLQATWSLSQLLVSHDRAHSRRQHRLAQVRRVPTRLIEERQPAGLRWLTTEFLSLRLFLFTALAVPSMPLGPDLVSPCAVPLPYLLCLGSSLFSLPVSPIPSSYPHVHTLMLLTFLLLASNIQILYKDHVIPLTVTCSQVPLEWR